MTNSKGMQNMMRSMQSWLSGSEAVLIICVIESQCFVRICKQTKKMFCTMLPPKHAALCKGEQRCNTCMKYMESLRIMVNLATIEYRSLTLQCSNKPYNERQSYINKKHIRNKCCVPANNRRVYQIRAPQYKNRIWQKFSQLDFCN